jgi:CDP-diacylglycerol---serine O-phosphatidyltransferase
MRKRADSRRKELPIIQLLPNAITLGAICAGLTAIRLAALGAVEVAASLIILACVLDGVDGRLARALRSESLLGAELDSLADFLNFGVAPAIIIYFWGLENAPDIGWRQC